MSVENTDLAAYHEDGAKPPTPEETQAAIDADVEHYSTGPEAQAAAAKAEAAFGSGAVTVEQSPERPAVKRPDAGDHKSKAKKKPKVKVKTVTRKEKDADGNDVEVPIGRSVKLHGVTVTVLDTALGDFETVDDLSLLGEAAEEYQAAGDKADEDLMLAAGERVAPLLRRLVGYQGSRSVLAALRREHGGRVEFEHAVEFVGDLISALSPNS